MISCKINGYENYELFRDGSKYGNKKKRDKKKQTTRKGRRTKKKIIKIKN